MIKNLNTSFGLLAFLPWNHKWNNFHFPPEAIDKAVCQIKELGSPTIRIDILWSDVRVNDTDFNFRQYDDIINKLIRAGIEVLAMLQYNKWAGDDPVQKWNTPPDSNAEFCRYVRKTVEHFKNRIHLYEIWNEPNHPNYWVETPNKFKTYCELLRRSYLTIKEVDPEIIVLNGGITEPILEFVNYLYENGGKDFTDILAIHTFLNPASPTALTEFDTILDNVRNLMIQHNDPHKKIWITEMGCPGLPAGKTMDWFAGKKVTEEEQSTWLERIYSQIKKHPGVEKLFWAFYRDTEGEFKDATDYLGLVRLDFSKKPSFFKMKELMAK